ncbi:MAG: M20/M25/M40 family metallo-hydrolase [Gemmatimonadota bacterium]
MQPWFERFLASDPIRAAAERISTSDEDTLADQMELTAIPAPPFQEEERGREMAARMAAAGLHEVGVDGVGNVLGWWPQQAGAAPVVLSAHLDTVFGPEIPIEVRRDGDRITGPGISDDGRGLAVILAVARALSAMRFQAGDGVMPQRPILFAATVGEEGAGDLRGARHLLGPDGAAHGAAAFLSIDGAGLDRIIRRGVGSRRFRAIFRGPGGHSWADWGRVNPLHAMGAAVARLGALAENLPARAALTAARMGGGTSVNAIAQEAWCELDLRSEDESALDELELQVREILEEGRRTEEVRSRGELTLEVATLGRRPAGATPRRHPLVRAAEDATRAVGIEPVGAAASTDANAAMALGIPAVTLGGGGRAGGAHTTGEWYENRDGPQGVLRALLTLLLAAGPQV